MFNVRKKGGSYPPSCSKIFTNWNFMMQNTFSCVKVYTLTLVQQKTPKQLLEITVPFR